MSKTRISADEYGRVTLEYTDALYDDRVIREFTCPVDGGYVIELLPNGTTKQPCEALGRTGNTLRCSSRANLLDMIRREYRAMRRAERALA